MSATQKSKKALMAENPNPLPQNPLPKKPPASDDPIKFAELPEMSELSKASQLRAANLLIELELVTGMESEAKIRGDEIKNLLEHIQQEEDVKGFRAGNLCFFSREVAGRRTLDRFLLIENGVTPDIIEASMKTGAGYMERRFKNLDEKKKK